MADSGRRQPPSPLVFTPETAFSPPRAAHGSNSTNTVSMPFVRRHVTRRLKASKAECDKDLQRITNNITVFFEERLRDVDYDHERGRAGIEHAEADALRDPFMFHVADLRSALQADESSSDGGYDAEPEFTRHSRTTSNSSSLSPGSQRRQSNTPWDRDRPLSSSVSSSAVSSSPATSTILLPEAAPLTRKASGAPTAWSNQGLPSRRLSRTIHIPRPSLSGHSSRSTSRSRSPLPPMSSHNSFSDYNGPPPPNPRRSSRILLDDPVDPIMNALYDLISVATDVIDMSVQQLTAQPKICESIVQRIQNIGKAWDEHPDWHGRNWYVQVLLAVASLSRVVEWWEAEKQFWNFDDKDEEMEEPLMFVTKPAEDSVPGPTPTLKRPDGEQTTGALRVSHEEEAKLRLSRPPSHNRRTRDEHHKEPSTSQEQEPASRSNSKILPPNESARVLATERLRLQAETTQNQNIVIELSLDGDHFLWINYAWRFVVKSEPEEMTGTRISRLLAPADRDVFVAATKCLRDDDSHTVEVRFKLQIRPDDERETTTPGVLYQQMEGKGMLMVDREDGEPSHTMWVIKPIGPPRYEHDSPSIKLPEDESSFFEDSSRLEPSTPFPFTQPICTDPIMCRICESQIPQWYFEKHSETCAETHRLEAEIVECNESIAELRNTIRDLAATIDRNSPAVPEYRGMPIFSPSTSPTISSPLQLFRANKMQRVGVKKMQRQLLDQLEDILQVAGEVSVPSLKEEEAKEPIERQRLLSPGSERKVSQVRNWSKPSTEDSALGQLVQDAERVMRQKLDNVARMQNTIRYSEKIWHEWEERVAQYLATVDESDSDESDDGQEPLPTPMAPRDYEDDDHSSTTSEYDYDGVGGGSSEPTPMAASPSPTPAPLPYDSRTARSIYPASGPQPLLIKTRKSSSSLLLDPSNGSTPPVSPLISTKEPSLTRDSSTKRGHRRHSTANFSQPPTSPRAPSTAPISRTTPTSIKDFDIIKPISKGAFGSVFLAKKKVTGDYFAIKVLKKADMIAKNQITNVKAERMILMKQAESPFVAKLYFTFQSKDNLYLVMEYLNGGDCAAMIKSLGSLPEEWTKNYIAEVVLGLEYLHQRGVVHRDLKPDNLLIDQHGHLKLTDFGLSRIGLLGRQTRENQSGRPLARTSSRSRPPSMDAAYLSSPLIHSDLNNSDDVSDASGSESLASIHLRKPPSKSSDSPLQSFATELTTDLRSHSASNSQSASTPPGEQKFVGTPDYLAPETILGLRGDDAAVDWWALGVITYEFLYGIPPFHAETPEKVFEKILSGHIVWHDEWVDFSPEARDFMARLMTLEPSTRLGAQGADEVKAHPFFEGIDWDQVTSTEAAFIPQITDPESTDYFDPRGAIPQLFHDDDQIAVGQSALNSPTVDSSMPPPAAPVPIPGRDASGGSDGDFGSFSYKNLPVLKQANDDVIRKFKTDQMTPLAHALSEPTNLHSRRRSVSHRFKKPPSVVTTIDPNNANKGMSTNPPSPATSSSSIASSPSRTSLPPSTPGSGGGHSRKPSEYGAVERFKLNHMDGGLDRRNSMPSRLRTASVSSAGDGSGSETWNSSSGHHDTPPSSVVSIDLRKGPDPNDRAVTCLLAEDNPITAKIIETLLIRLGCRCVVVGDGSEVISVAMGDIKFDCILMDLHMPVLDGEGAARYLKTTNGKNTTTPIIAISAYDGADALSGADNLFAASLSKPLQKNDLLHALRELGFKTSTVQGTSTKVTTAHS
uniref:non-specific serine/threonine protein kinase n=1 Tax=Mycena chlorophos TaxID=658473 RepID=A0ABQ0M9B3_MYCCL|nr:serine/threonine protein [Mycena chlorophos]